MLPRLVRRSCGSKGVRRERAKVVPRAEGVVLDVGIGPGLNLPFLDPGRVRHVVGIDPSEAILALGRPLFEAAAVPVEVVTGGAEEMPFEGGHFDTAVLAYTACSIPRVKEALHEIRRVLKPSGQLLFLEHGRAPDARVARWQDRLDGVWGLVSGGCHLNRDIELLVRGAGFELEEIETYYARGFPRFAGFHFRGVARPG